jgi:eukaryotic-like serine/threonine-protein kinase
MLELSTLGGYRVDDIIGEGGVAIVCLGARVDGSGDESADRPARVALKVLKPNIANDPNVLSSFQYECRVMGRLDHPGILRIYDSGMEREAVFAVLELVEGLAFDAYLRKRTKLAQGEAVSLGIQLADALDHLHSRGYVHRDLKPGNLMLTDEGRLVLMDFGTVVQAAAGADYEVGLFGTPGFIAPEQIEPGGRVDGRADLYAAGMMLYMMLTGQRPFYGSREDMLEAQLTQEPVPPSAHVRVSPELDALVLRTLAKSPDDRPATGAELADALRSAAAAGEPEPPSLSDRLFGWARRKG